MSIRCHFAMDDREKGFVEDIPLSWIQVSQETGRHISFSFQEADPSRHVSPPYFDGAVDHPLEVRQN